MAWFDEINDSIERAKALRGTVLKRFKVGDVVYPIWQTWEHPIWGVVVYIDPVCHKLRVNVNGVERQFDPEDVIPVNPELKKQLLGEDGKRQRKELLETFVDQSYPTTPVAMRSASGKPVVRFTASRK